MVKAEGTSPLALPCFSRPARARGVSLIFAVFSMAAILALCSLAVDLGRVQLAKTELHAAVDAAARHAVTAFTEGSTNPVTLARNRAKAVAAENRVDGTPLVLTNADIEFGLWDGGTGAFTLLTGSARQNANAVRITAHRTAQRNGAIPLSFASIIGYREFELTVTCIASATSSINVDQTIKATSNPWLAGMPDGTLANVGNPKNKPDRAPAQSPDLITGLPLYPGMEIAFDTIGGDARHDPNLADYDPDGNVGSTTWNFGGSEHGKSNLRAPINALIGVFLSDGRPDLTPPPPSLDFGSASSREFTSLSPQLKQVFFIGDGRTSTGLTQKFVVPPGATRLYLGMMDGYEWSNNLGTRTVKIRRLGSVKLVK